MAAYAGLTSLMNIIHQLQQHPPPNISLEIKQLNSLTEIVSFLLGFLEGYHSPVADNEPDPLEMRIADAAYAAQDVIESHIVDAIKPCNTFFLKQSQQFQDLQEVINGMNLIKKEIEKVKTGVDQAQLHKNHDSPYARSAIMVETCRGLPLSIVVIGGLLKNLEHTQECWESIRQNSSSVGNSENEEFCFKILKLSYDHLPVYLKPCFLYMGVFEEDRVVRVSTLVKLWVSEGFLKPASGKSLETAAREYLNDLVDRNLILVHEFGSIGNIKYCKIHDLLRDLCCREAEKEGFYNVIGKHKFQSLNRQRCVVIRGSSSKEEVDDTLQSMPLARSLLCDSKETVLLPKSRMLRVLKTYDRDTSGSYDYFFIDLFEFVNLRYLAVGVRGKDEFLPSVSFLWNLHTLIIFYSTYIITPNEIWEMPQLRHIEFHKGVLFPSKDMHPLSERPIIMENLQTLKGVNFLYGGTIFEIIPHIKKLGLEGEIPPYLICLSELESCRCWGGSSHFGEFQSTGFPYSRNKLGECNFPHSLKKLSLGSSSSHWELNSWMLEKLGALPNLEKLKLERAQFTRGFLKEYWETSEDRFPSLKYLGMKWCRLECWVTESSHFPCLEKLHLCGLRGLKEIPCEIGEIPSLQLIMLEYCSEAVVESAKNITEEQEGVQVRVVLFNNDKNQALRSHASSNFVVEVVDFSV